jgi:hypothetical protein
MTKAIGRLANLGIGKETVRGTGVSAGFWIPNVTLSFDDKVTKVTSALSYGTINMFGNQSLVAQKWAEGTVEGEVMDKSFGLFLLALLGTVSSGVSETTAYQHTYTLQEDNQHDSLSMHIDEPNGDLIFELAMIESLEITSMPEDVVRFTVDFKSKSSQASSGSASYIAENKFLGRHTTFKVAANTGALDAASGISLKSLTLTFNKNLLLDQVLGTVQPEDILNKALSITGEIELLYNDRSYANYMLDGSYRAVRIDIVNTDVTIGATSNPSFRLDLSRVEFNSWDVSRENDEIMSQTIQFTGLYDLTNANTINSCYLINETTSY